MIRRRLVAVAPGGHIIGYAIAAHFGGMLPGRFYTWVTTSAEWRGQGIGHQLYESALQIVAEHGGDCLESEVEEADAAGRRFAEQLGFEITGHLFGSTLDLATFDESPFSHIVPAVEASGIRFTSLAEEDTPAMRRQLHEVNYRTVLDIPGREGTFFSFEEFSQMVFDSSWYRPGGQILALDGATAVGLAAVAFYPDTGLAYHNMTGVDSAYRGRKIAQALKLLAIRFGRQIGATHMRTHNDSRNAPMLAINGKLGYRPEPGKFRLAKYLGTGYH
jgi:GNAT superfamily N-acetyltransferase